MMGARKAKADTAPPGGTPATDAALRWMHAAGAEAELLVEVGRSVRARRRRTQALAVGGIAGCLALGATFFAWRGAETASSPLPHVAAAPVGPAKATAAIVAPERQVLADGSVVELKAGAAIATAFAADVRAVTLLRGEAHFQVVKDAARPFIVTAAGVAVRAVGTAFTVQLQSTAVEVLVSEGRVAVEQPQATPRRPALLDRGGRARVPVPGARPEVGEVSPVELAQRLAWRVPQLEFSQTPLPEIVRLMNEHGGAVQLVIDLPAHEAAEIKLSGFLAADNVAGVVGLLEASFPVRGEWSDALVRLRRR